MNLKTKLCRRLVYQSFTRDLAKTQNSHNSLALTPSKNTHAISFTHKGCDCK